MLKICVAPMSWPSICVDDMCGIYVVGYMCWQYVLHLCRDDLYVLMMCVAPMSWVYVLKICLTPYVVTIHMYVCHLSRGLYVLTICVAPMSWRFICVDDMCGAYVVVNMCWRYVWHHMSWPYICVEDMSGMICREDLCRELWICLAVMSWSIIETSTKFHVCVIFW